MVFLAELPGDVGGHQQHHHHPHHPHRHAVCPSLGHGSSFNAPLPLHGAHPSPATSFFDAHKDTSFFQCCRAPAGSCHSGAICPQGTHVCPGGCLRAKHVVFENISTAKKHVDFEYKNKRFFVTRTRPSGNIGKDIVSGAMGFFGQSKHDPVAKDFFVEKAGVRPGAVLESVDGNPVQATSVDRLWAEIRNSGARAHPHDYGHAVRRLAEQEPPVAVKKFPGSLHSSEGHNLTFGGPFRRDCEARWGCKSTCAASQLCCCAHKKTAECNGETWKSDKLPSDPDAPKICDSESAGCRVEPGGNVCFNRFSNLIPRDGVENPEDAMHAAKDLGKSLAPM